MYIAGLGITIVSASLALYMATLWIEILTFYIIDIIHAVAHFEVAIVNLYHNSTFRQINMTILRRVLLLIRRQNFL